jgi:GR25 family glycosyltransferase involved in LPS biosynthesis
MSKMALLGLPTFVINLDRCQERYYITSERIQKAGFTNIHRYRAVDAKNPAELSATWESHGNPKFDPARTEFVKWKGEQGCALSHLNIWRTIVNEKIPKAVVFEDDVFFHKDWDKLHTPFWSATPNDYDILYLGSQLEIPSNSAICRVPVYCTHAYVITCEGAAKLYNHVLTGFPQGLCAIDSLLLETMYKSLGGQAPVFNWYVWNGTHIPDPAAVVDPEWAKRNRGLVFQDPVFGTDVKPRNDAQAQAMAAI